MYKTKQINYNLKLILLHFNLFEIILQNVLQRWIKRLRTPEIKNYMMSTKTLKNDVYLTAIINTQEQEIQRLKVINNEFRNKLLKHKVSFYSLIIYVHN